MCHFLLIPANGFNDCLQQSQRQSSNTKAHNSLSDYIVGVAMQ